MTAKAHVFYGYSLQTAEGWAELYSKRFPMLTYRVLRCERSPEGFGYFSKTEAVAGEKGWEDRPFTLPDGYELVSVWRNGEKVSE